METPATKNGDILMMGLGCDEKAVPCSERINLYHWSDGGTALTNLHRDSLRLFLSAINAHGDDRYVVVLAPMERTWGLYQKPTNCFSLHFTEATSQCDCSDFWKTFRKVEAENKPPPVPEVCPRDTDGDGNCGRPACPICRISTQNIPSHFDEVIDRHFWDMF